MDYALSVMVVWCKEISRVILVPSGLSAATYTMLQFIKKVFVVIDYL